MPELTQQTLLHAPALTFIPREHWTIVVDAEAPNWVSCDERGAWILRAVTVSPARFSELVSRYASWQSLDVAKAWVHVQAFVSEAIRHGLLSLAPISRPPYRGRAHHLALSFLLYLLVRSNRKVSL